MILRCVKDDASSLSGSSCECGLWDIRVAGLGFEGYEGTLRPWASFIVTSRGESNVSFQVTMNH